MPRRAGSGYRPPDIASTPDEWLEELAADRALPVSLMAEVGITVDWDRSEEHPIFIPYPHMQGIWYERQRRWIDDDRKPKYKSPRHSEPHLYNPWFLGPNADHLYLCEGEFDALSLISLGRPAVGVAGVGAFDRRWLHLYRYATVILAYDGDEAGRKAEMKLAEYIDPRQLHHLKVPDGEDLNGMLMAGTLLEHVERFEEREGI